MWIYLLVANVVALLVDSYDISNIDVFTRPDVTADVMKFLQWKDAIFVYDWSLSAKERHGLLEAIVEHQVGTVTLRLTSLEPDVVMSLLAVIQSTTITTVLLCVQRQTLLVLLEKAKDSDMLQQQYQWLAICVEVEPNAILKVLCCAPSNVALLFPSMTSSSSDVSHKTTSCTDYNVTALKSEADKTMSLQEQEAHLSDVRQQEHYVACSYSSITASFLQVATWTPVSGLQAPDGVLYPHLFGQFHNTTLRIGAWEAMPFTERISEGNRTVGYKGFCIDLLDEMARYLNFKYDIIEPPDGQYGAPAENGTWNGMVGMLIRGELDMAVGPFSITPERKEVVDFTVPYMEDGGGILTKGGDPGPDLLNVFRPFSLAVWLTMGTVVVATAVTLFAVTKVNDFLHFRKQKESWTLEYCLFTIFGSLMFQGADRHPVSSPGRLVLGCWWLFTILIVSIYTASLAALLTVPVQGNTVESIQDLADSSLYPVTIMGSNWWTLFMNAKKGPYGAVGEKMAKSPQVRVNEDALKLVYEGTGAFIVDWNQVNYLYGQDCKNLHKASYVFSSNGLGFVLPKNAYFKEIISKIILKLQEGGFLETWKRRWWKTSVECGSRVPSVSSTGQMHVLSFGGILIIYLAVIVLSLLCMLLGLRQMTAFRRKWLPTLFALLWRHRPVDVSPN